MDKTALSLYIHIPFCQSKCIYCDFNSYAGKNALYVPYVEALLNEITMTAETYFPTGTRPNVETIFFGGGTPSLLPPEEIGRILEMCHQNFNILPGAEVTLEANPGTITAGQFESLREYGVNRISMGVQTLDDTALKHLGRIHTVAQAIESYRLALAAGFNRINLDFIYGLPYQTTAQWAEWVDRIIDLAPPHISAYALQVEEHTALYTAVRFGKIPVPDDDEVANMYDIVRAKLKGAGYRHYEISNWARLRGEEDFRSQHNLVYWHNGTWLGFGAGAHSYFQGRRYGNLAPLNDYIKTINNGNLPVDPVTIEEPDLPTVMGETMMLALRLDEGMSLAGFAQRFGRHIDEVYRDVIAQTVAEELLMYKDGALKLTPRGQLLGNEVFARFLPEAAHTPMIT